MLARRGLILVALVQSLWAGTAFAAEQKPPPLCFNDAKAYSLGAVIRADGRALRCTRVFLSDVNAPPAFAWVELTADVQALKLMTP